MPRGRFAPDESGHLYGRLTVIAREPNRGSYATWRCRCVCGNEVVVTATMLRSGNTTSCGCLRTEKTVARSFRHGAARRRRIWPEYYVWAEMVQRCTNTAHPQYRDYGGRGVAVEFRSFDEFIEEVGRRPSPDLTIDRIDNDRGYAPGNVRWATYTEQRLNQRRMKPSKGGI